MCSYATKPSKHFKANMHFVTRQNKFEDTNDFYGNMRLNSNYGIREETFVEKTECDSSGSVCDCPIPISTALRCVHPRIKRKAFCVLILGRKTEQYNVCNLIKFLQFNFIHYLNFKSMKNP